MLSPSKSPIHALVFPWWTGKSVQAKEVPALRQALAMAIVEEFPLHPVTDDYDPFCDHRVIWAAQFLRFSTGDSARIHPDTIAAAAWVFDPPLATDRKTLAAGDDANAA